MGFWKSITSPFKDAWKAVAPAEDNAPPGSTYSFEPATRAAQEAENERLKKLAAEPEIAADGAAKKEQKPRGRAATIFTGPSGLSGNAYPSARRTLLGS